MAQTATPAAATGTGRPAYRDANVLRWLGAYTASMLGDSVYFVALGFAAARAVPAAQVGLVMAAGAVPRALLMLGGGVVADRFGPRRVVIGSDAVRCVLILAAAAGLAATSPGLWLLVALALAFGVVDALFMPAVGALPPRITTADQLVRVQGLRALVVRLGQVAGPPAGGLAMGLGGGATAFLVAGLLFAVSVPLLLRTRIGAGPRPAAARAPAGRELRDGLGYVRRHPLVGPLVLSGALCELGLAGPMNVGMVLLAERRGWGASGYGWVIAAFGAGAALSAALLAARGRIRRAGAVQIATLLAGSTALGLIGIVPTLAAAAATAFVAGLVCGVCGGLATALIQTATAPGYLGRVTSVMSLTGFGLAPLAYPLFAAAAGALGPSPVFLASALLAAAGGAFTAFLPSVRTAELP
ncbi:MFS transporter [Streptomyces sp. NPDC021020]|uniref:MFS transporter n=1 Tax=Streptomyces sp. NPDC021020 TaxID=3365109 RepID=UPI0037BA7E68